MLLQTVPKSLKAWCQRGDNTFDQCLSGTEPSILPGLFHSVSPSPMKWPLYIYPYITVEDIEQQRVNAGQGNKDRPAVGQLPVKRWIPGQPKPGSFFMTQSSKSRLEVSTNALDKGFFKTKQNKTTGVCIELFLKMYFKLEDNYNIALVSALHQHESAIGIHMSPPS